MNDYPLLEKNATGSYVRILQDKLKILGLYPGTVTSSFGVTTENAVKDFQSDYGLPVTGIVDDTTWAVLFNETKSPFSFLRQSKPTLRLGSTGEYVEELQKDLKTLLYYNGNITGTFDATTENAVKAFQTINKLTSDGIVGADTWSALAYLYSPLAICGEEETPHITPPEEDSGTYIVKPGDTLYSIAGKYGVTVGELKRINNLTANNLSIGQELIVPKTTTEEPEVPAGNNYTVVSGDTLWSIAKKFGISVDELKRANNLTNNTLSIGQQLIIPKSTPEEEEPGTEYSEYTVKRGDNLYAIAREYGITIDELMRINNLNTTLLSIGQVLKVPKKSEPQIVDYIVKAGDTLYSIARKFNTSVDAIMDFNNLASSVLTIGKLLKILI